MIVNIIDGATCVLKEVCQYSSYTFRWDIDFNDMSSIVVQGSPSVASGDYAVCFDDNHKTLFTGLIVSTTDAQDGLTINMKQIQNVFDRQIILSGEGTAKTSLELFLANTVRNHWVINVDTLLDLTYIVPAALTNTPYKKKIPTENGIYNLKTFLGNIIEDGFLTRVEFVNNTMNVYFGHPYQGRYNIALSGVSDVTNVDETYSVDVLARLNVKWKIPDDEFAGTIGATTYPVFYFTSRGDITMDVNDPQRVIGKVDAIYSEQDSYEAMLADAVMQFQSQNSYSHKITANIYSRSKAYPLDDLFVGKKVGVWSHRKAVTSLITAIERSSDRPYAVVTFGMLPVYLTDKLKRRA